MKHLGTTPPFRGPHGERMPDSIAEVRYMRLGGVDQWLMIRGERITNPPLILLHGGPGWSETFFFRHFNAPLESAFTVVYWDQRGAGKSFNRRIPKESMTVEQFLCDLDQLVASVRHRLGQRKVVLFGHSWGSVLGALYAARFPDKVAVYVGCEQIGDAASAEAASYAFALAEAQRLRNRKVLGRLRAIGPPPYPAARSLFKERTCVARLEGQLSASMLWDLTKIVLGGPEMSVLDVPNLLRGFRFSLDAMWPEVSTLNLQKLVPALSMPVVFFASRRDHWVPAGTSLAYFDALRAPSKQLVWFEESGHEPFIDEPAKFNRAMLELVRPIVDVPRRDAA